MPSSGWTHSLLKVLDLEGNALFKIQEAVFKDSKIHNLNLKDNHIDRKTLMAIDGLDLYQ